MHGRDHRLGQVQDAEHHGARLVQNPGADSGVVGHLLEQVEGTAGGERLALALDEYDPGLRVAVDDRPDLGEVAVHPRVDRVEVGCVKHDAQNAERGSLET